MKFFKSRLFKIALLPNLLFTLLLILQGMTTGKLASSTMYAASLLDDAGGIQTFYVIRNIYLLGYLLFAAYSIYNYIQSKQRNRKSLLRLLGIIALGAFISQFTFFLAAISYDIISMILRLF